MFGIFRCNHPARSLLVKGEQLVEKIDKEVDRVTYRLMCGKCGVDVDVTHARLGSCIQTWLKMGK